jgi:hypothetical protein
MVSVATVDRATFLRERYARSIRVAVRLFTRQWLYAAYLVAGVGTLILCIAPSALVEAITFCVYVTSLTAFVYFDRRRFGRALADYENVQPEAGPDPDPEATRAMPRHMLTVDDAIDLPMLDAILVLGGDSLDEHNRVTKPLQKNFRAYTAAYFWLFLVYLCAFVAFVALVADHPAAQRHLGELAIALLASVPARAAVQDMNTYMQFAQRYVLARVDSAEKALKTLASREHPFVDGRAVRYRGGKYIVDRKATNPRVDGRSIDRHRRTSRQFGAGVWLGIGVALSVLVFIVHPISGILVS